MSRAMSPPHSTGRACPILLLIRIQSWQAVPGPLQGIRLTRAPGPVQRWAGERSLLFAGTSQRPGFKHP